ncbi:hypothetical protein HYH03_003777 [Edaphochlamys debaryana]|uniref:gamma-glutamylcyclotransferase n=1 Tax=Edaphochlamys debaryana TaxID=47281 RepID=A0A835Y916_9CHLO|nr:hypothetical protein HYH03_003777 [Edaphochlamys debaryana]|eukprot:KAG2498527.1 hypothetical protein HYH03_003777 [Edaphochlamys debaryana]
MDVPRSDLMLRRGSQRVQLPARRTCVAHAIPRGSSSGKRKLLSSAWAAWAGAGAVAWRDETEVESKVPAAPPTPAPAGTSSPEAREGPGPVADASAAPGDASASQAASSPQNGSSKSRSGAPLTLPIPSSMPPAAGLPAFRLPSFGQRRKDGNAATDTVLTFAYGANMNRGTIAKRDVQVLSRDPAVVDDPSIRLVFKHQGGYGTLERMEEGESTAEGGQHEEPRFRPYDGHVHGVLYRVTRADFEKLSKKEGGYRVEEVLVRTYDGAQYRALAFVSNPLFKLPQEVLPTEKYVAKLREGAADNYLDPDYQAFLSGISTVSSAGLPSDYFNTPSRYMGYAFLGISALVAAAFFLQ